MNILNNNNQETVNPKVLGETIKKQERIEEMLRFRRELVNEAVEYFGYDVVKIEEYVNSRSVA